MERHNHQEPESREDCPACRAFLAGKQPSEEDGIYVNEWNERFAELYIHTYDELISRGRIDVTADPHNNNEILEIVRTKFNDERSKL
jgi:hypothetical protein